MQTEILLDFTLHVSRVSSETESLDMDSIPHAFDAGNQGSSIVTASIIVTVFATIAVGLRIISRRMLRLSLEADDYSILIALVSRNP